MLSRSLAAFAVALSVFLAIPGAYADKAFLLNGIDTKIDFSTPGKIEFVEPGIDLVNIMDISNPARPRTVANLPISNSIFGPPTNLQVTPDEKLALVASAVKWEQKDGAWKPAPDDRLFVIDLETDPPALVATLNVGRQPSGMAIRAQGDLALVANRADNSVSVLAINGKQVRLVDTVAIGDQVAAVAITPDGKRALIVKNTTNQIGVLAIDGQQVSYREDLDMPVGQFPYNIDIAPDGSMAIVANTGNGGLGDGHADPLTVIDLASTRPPYVAGYVNAGDAPEAFGISPSGKIAVALLLGGDVLLPVDHWAHSVKGSIAVFAINGLELNMVQSIDLGGLPEGVAFSPDGAYMYVSTFVGKEVAVYQVRGTRVRDTGVRVSLPGPPGSMRARAR
ncbi:MAG: beta-propeller fold lactonase family protein [Betaproteobacteria bacterium]|nr:MAG: beta-propeller fold lactonase family protein [Betaproteobacteria bacterium]